MQDTIVVSAHLDDAVLSCYSALGPSTTVVTVFAGLPPDSVLSSWDAKGGATSSRERMAERREEDRRALGPSGTPFIHLDHPSVQFVELGAAERPSPAELAAALRTLLGDVKTVLAPSALSANRPLQRFRRRRYSDHRFVRDAVLAARPDATLYADLPYALNPGTGGFVLPRDLDGSRRSERRVELDDALVAEKLEAVRCYDSQLEQLVQIFGDFVTPEGLGLEVYWEPSPR